MTGRQIHFLHIGKTGGTALRLALLPFAGGRLVFHEHEFGLPDVPAPDLAIFTVRHPVSRFVSGFYSRLRKGQPRINAAWSPAEHEAFTRFSTANALAEALSSDDPEHAQAAQTAMRAINHVNSPLANWLVDAGFLLKRRSQIEFIAHQPDLDEDFERITKRLDLPHAKLPVDPIDRHENPKTFDVALSDLADANLRRWYNAEFPLYDLCLRLRREIIKTQHASETQLQP